MALLLLQKGCAMQTPRRLPTAAFCLASGFVPLILAWALPTSISHAAAPLETPQQVADTLDSIVQPRFQKNAGRFGVDRVVHPEGHEQIDWIDPSSRFERRHFAVVNASHRSYVIAFLHCFHKPGAHTNPPTPAEPLSSDFRPSTSALVTVGGTQAGADRIFKWANKALNPLVLP